MLAFRLACCVTKAQRLLVSHLQRPLQNSFKVLTNLSNRILKLELTESIYVIHIEQTLCSKSAEFRANFHDQENRIIMIKLSSNSLNFLKKLQLFSYSTLQKHKIFINYICMSYFSFCPDKCKFIFST